MPNRTVRKNSVVDLLSKVPVNKGSLLTSIENLLKTIESSESAVMIPTLLRDKCEFDAWELLFVAKILKASILGHVDLVEFYMNHIGLNSSQFAASQTSNTTTPTATANNNNHTSSFSSNNGTPTGTPADSNNQPLSPSTNGHHNHNHHHPRQMSSPNLSPTTTTSNSTATLSSQTHQQVNPAAGSSGGSSISSVTTTLSSGSTNQQSTSSKSQSSVSWMTANQLQSCSSSPGASVASSLDGHQTETNTGSQQVTSEPPGTNHQDQTTGSLLAPVVPAGVVARSPIGLGGSRQAQPPSLLQLTTTNNHINSVAGTNNTIDQLTNQLSTMQTNGCLATKPQPPTSLDGLTLSISTTATAAQHSPNGNGNGNAHLPSQTLGANGGLQAAVAAVNSITIPHPPAELRSSRSAGCLFRMNSGASSPRTPTTPYPQAETLALGQANGLPGDPSAPVKLLLQIEQLKLSISHVTSLLESVVELYKKSIDNMA